MAGKFALIIGNSRYDDSSLGRLKAPDIDVQGLEEVLKAPDIGHFDEVITLLNESGATVRKAVARFYDQRHRDDLLLLYFSGHGVKDEQGHLYLAVRDTESRLLSGTAIETAFISGRMDRSFSKRQLLVLDCCHSGAFAHGAKAAQGVSVGTAEAFEGTGLGRVILTATDSTQYAWEGDQIIGDAQNSLFTHFLIEGLKTGAADRDEDGVVTVDELYDYVREHVVNSTPRQTPHKWTYQQQGEIVLAQNPVVNRSLLPPEIEDGIRSKLSSLRLEAVRQLETLLVGRHVGRARAAFAALKDLALDDSQKVAKAAAEAVKIHGADDPARTVVPVRTAPPAAVSDIFISYAHADREKARGLAKALVARGWKVWWDRKIAPGEAFDEVIERELGTCKCAIVLWSARSVHATWVKNEARRAARRKVLVPILIDPVDTPLEFENLQAADLTTWKAGADHPEFESVLERIQALSPIPDERLARAAVEGARREFGAGRREQALARLDAFRPAHVLVSRALTELRAEADRIDRERAETVRRETEAADRQRVEAENRQRAIVAEKARIEDLLAGLDLDAAERALAIADSTFERPGEFRPLRERLDILRGEAQYEQLARTAVEGARQEFGGGRHEAALRSLEQFRPPHGLVTRALTELRAEAERIECERAEAARREAEAARRHRELGAVTAQIEDFIRRLELDAADLALSTAERRFEYPADLRPLRERVDALRSEAQREQLVRNAVEDARREAESAQRPQALVIEEARTDDESIIETAEALPPPREWYDENLRQAPLAVNVAAGADLRTSSPAKFRPVLIAVAGILTLIVGTWLVGVWLGRLPRGPGGPRQSQNPVTESSKPEPAGPSPIARKRSVENASRSSRTASPAPGTSPIERVEPKSDAPPEITVVPNKSGDSAADKRESLSVQLEQLRTQARTSRLSGQREQALNAVGQGLQLVPRDPVLRTMRDSMLTEARESAARSRKDAVALDAGERAGRAFSQGREHERTAEKLRRTGKIEDATRSFWMASDQFSAAAAESRRIADKEEADERALIKSRENEPDAKQVPRTPIQPEQKPVAVPTDAENVAAANETLRRYETAYSTLRVDAVRRVYPSAPIDELEKDFADASSFTLKVVINDNWSVSNSGSQSFGTLASATGRITKTVVRKSGVPTTSPERPVTIHLEKRPNSWIITRIR